ncbi:nectin-4 isoform X3 [Epinephelus fuscoguttatus]|uniref:nectin-4 isoform X3 n=1 Tax=Epinephelus fuscoguttatus TaxID=293821 RepID=UPI0020D06451|nr:nectin-4 isoform X3 [Epinephelus fuscoguttatus]
MWAATLRSPVICCVCLWICDKSADGGEAHLRLFGLKVIGGNITVVQGETAILPCKLVDTAEPLTQISWQKMTRGKPQNDNFYTILAKNGPQFVNGRDDRFAFVGNFNENDGSLELSNTTLMDEGTYTCIFTLFPSGNHKTEIPLNLLVPPVISLKDDPVTLGDEEVSLVTCTAAGSRPPAEVVWITGTLEESVRITTNYSSHANGTTTTVSSLFGIPTKKINGHSVQCVVTSAARLDKETLNFNIQVFFPPMGVNITEKSQGVFECLTEANPPSTFTWQRISQPMPQSAVKVEGATLQLLSMTSNLNGLYQCEASNPYGSEHSHLYVHVNSGKGACTACWTILIILLILIAFGAAAAWYYYKYSTFPSALTRMVEWIPRQRQQVPTDSDEPTQAVPLDAGEQQAAQEGSHPTPSQ